MEDDIKISKFVETWYNYKKYSSTESSDIIFSYAFHALLHLFIIHVLCKYDCDKYLSVINSKSSSSQVLLKANEKHAIINKSYKDTPFNAYSTINIKQVVIKILKNQIKLQNRIETNLAIYKDHKFINLYFIKLNETITDIIKLLQKPWDNCNKDFDKLQCLSFKLLNFYITNIHKVYAIITKNENEDTAPDYGNTLYAMTLPELKKLAAKMKLLNYSKLNKMELILLIQQNK